MSHLKHANCEQNQLPNRIILPRQKEEEYWKMLYWTNQLIENVYGKIRNIAAKKNTVQQNQQIQLHMC